MVKTGGIVMKKVFLVLAAAAVAALGILSCSKEQMVETTPSEEGIQLNITVGQLDGTADPDTKAVKKGWTNGDRINIWYDENLGQNPDLVIAYDGSKWAVDHSAAVSGKAPSANGKLVAIYVDGSLSDFTYSGEEKSCTFNAPRFSNVVDGVNRPCRMPLVSYVDRTDYSFASDILTSNLTNWVFGGSNVQVVISGLAAGDEWVLSCDKFRAPNRIVISNNNPAIRVAVTSASAYGNYAIANKNADGSAFVYHYSGTDTDFTFTLFNARTGEKLAYSVSGKSLDATGYKLNAIKIPFSKFSDPRAVDLGLSVKWATMNIGANDSLESGYYFAWGETVQKSDYAWSSYKYCKGSFDTFTKYCKDPEYGTVDNKTVLEMKDDAAAVNWGGSWRMPTKAEWEELLDPANCEWTRTETGYYVQSKKTGFTDKRIFLRGAGYFTGSKLIPDGDLYYWSSTLASSVMYGYDEEAYIMHTNSMSTSDRFLGYPVRAVTE